MSNLLMVLNDVKSIEDIDIMSNQMIILNDVKSIDDQCEWCQINWCS